MRFPVSSSERNLAYMLHLKCAVLAVIILVAGVLAYGKSIGPVDLGPPRVFQPANASVSANRLAPEQAAAFHSSLRDVPRDKTEITTAQSNNSHPTETAKDEHPVTLPEPGTGILFGLGLLAISTLPVMRAVR